MPTALGAVLCPASRSLIVTLKTTGPKMEPCGALLVSAHQPGNYLQITSFLPLTCSSQLSSNYPEENPERLPKYCANANYILTLLLDAYKFNETSWNNIVFQMKVSRELGQQVGMCSTGLTQCLLSLGRWGAPMWAGLWATC